MLPHEDRPQFGKGARILKVEWVTDRGNKDIELVVAMEHGTARPGLHDGSGGTPQVAEAFFDGVTEPAEETCLARLGSGNPAIECFFPRIRTDGGCPEGSRRRWRGRRRRVGKLGPDNRRVS